mmetsp:Transcript_59692/g.128221  ORF Transcript_59692/g.128221 Transcript_59692/m.128221 type:complete len:265 (-) Transcript_59692:83-877(-)
MRVLGEAIILHGGRPAGCGATSAPHRELGLTIVSRGAIHSFGRGLCCSCLLGATAIGMPEAPSLLRPGPLLILPRASGLTIVRRGGCGQSGGYMFGAAAASFVGRARSVAGRGGCGRSGNDMLGGAATPFLGRALSAAGLACASDSRRSCNGVDALVGHCSLLLGTSCAGQWQAAPAQVLTAPSPLPCDPSLLRFGLAIKRRRRRCCRRTRRAFLGSAANAALNLGVGCPRGCRRCVATAWGKCRPASLALVLAAPLLLGRRPI